MNLLRLWKTFLSFSVSNLIAYRTDLALRLIGMLFNVLFMVIILVLPYRYTDTLAGWQMHEVLIVIGMYFFINGISWAIFKDGIFRMEDKVKYGLMDAILLKPVDSIFMTAFLEIDMTRFADALVGLLIIVSQVVSAGVELNVLNFCATAVSCIASLAIVFALYFSANTLSFWTTEAYIGHVSNPVFSIAKYPVDMWGEKMSRFFYWVVPIGFMSSVPAAVLVGKLPWWWALASVAVAAVWIIGTKNLWTIAVKRYSGTGS